MAWGTAGHIRSRDEHHLRHPALAKTASGAPINPASATAYQLLLGAGSNHPGGVNFAMADGLIQFGSDGIPLGLYRALATIAGGEAATVP